MFVIYHVGSTMQLGPCNGHPHTLYAKTYKRAGDAKRLCDRWNEMYRPADKHGPGEYGWCTVDHYRNRVVKMVTRTNLLSGKQYQEPSNTPGYCSPSSEAYWSM